MSIRIRIVLSFLFIISLGFYFFVDWIAKELTPRYMESVEESLIDTSRIVAAFIALEVKDGKINIAPVKNSLTKVYSERFKSEIYQFTKTQVDLRILITDKNGMVIFDSFNGQEEGKDYSNWNDIYLTLRGRYGARSSLMDQNDPRSGALFVAAPVLNSGQQIIGAVSICKPKHNIRKFIQMAKEKIIVAGIMSGAALFLIGILISVWITYPIKRLIRHTKAIQQGRKSHYPQLGQNELGTLSNALEQMKEALEGKKYIENYILTLTHELKSPLSAIKGSAELLKEEVPPDKKEKFLDHILSELERIKQMIERLLLLSSLENRDSLEHIESFDLSILLKELTESFSPVLIARQIQIANKTDSPMIVKGEPFLIRQALSNIIQNAIDFSPKKSSITITSENGTNKIAIMVKDNGPGIPEYARDQIFNKFYSLPRPDTNRKSSGLGLCFVRLVAALHNGEIEISGKNGTLAIFSLPINR